MDADVIREIDGIKKRLDDYDTQGGLTACKLNAAKINNLLALYEKCNAQEEKHNAEVKDRLKSLEKGITNMQIQNVEQRQELVKDIGKQQREENNRMLKWLSGIISIVGMLVLILKYLG